MITLKNNSIILLAVLAIASGSLNACHSDSAEKNSEKSEVTPIEVFTLQTGTLNSSIQIPGELLPYQQVDLYAKSSSYVKKLNVDIGSEVHRGQLLITLDAPEITSQLAEAKSRIKQQEALYVASKAMYERLVNTGKTPGTVAQNDIDQAAAKQNADKANLEAAQSYYQQISANLGYLEIRAPFDGIVTARNVNEGAYVGPSGKGSELPLLVIQEQKHLRLVVSVPEAYTGNLNLNDEITFTVRAIPNQQFKARIKRLAGALDSRLRAERIEMDVNNDNKKLLPGMYAEVNVAMPGKKGTLIAPKTAVVTSTEKVFVIRVNNNKAQWVDVSKGLQDNDSTEIFGVLKPGDKLVTHATDEITDGQPVEVTNK